MGDPVQESFFADVPSAPVKRSGKKAPRDFTWMRDQDWGCVTTHEELEQVKARILKASREGRLWCFDYETTSLVGFEAKICGISFSDLEG